MSGSARAAGTGVAFLAACAVIGGGGVALAVPSSAVPSNAVPSHAVSSNAKPAVHASHKPVDHLAGQRVGAGHALAADTARVTRIASAEAASSVLSAVNKAALATASSADLAALSTDKGTVASATTAAQIRAAMLAGGRTAHGAQLQLQVLTSADQGQLSVVTLTSNAAALAAQAQTLQDNGTDISTVTTPLADLATAVAQADADIQTATATALAVPTSPTDPQLHTAVVTARQQLAAATAALTAATQDLSTATDALTALQTPTA